MKKFALAVALCASLLSSAAQAKTFVGVLWPMFGPLPAIGLVELVAELKAMPDVEVETYVHQAWPSLVDDLDRQPPGTHKVVIGYSLGANSTVFVANNAKYVDLIVALQPSMLSWNPPLTGKVGRVIEIYNPNPWLTWGGMGSKKLIGENIEYITNNDSHPGAQFNSQFRHLVKSEVAKFIEEDRLESVQAAAAPAPLELAQADQAAERDAAATADRPNDAPDRRDMAQGEKPKLPAPAVPERVAQERPADRVSDLAAERQRSPAQREMPKASGPAAPERLARQRSKHRPDELTAFLETLSNSVDSGDLSAQRELTPAAMLAYARRTYGASPEPEKLVGRPVSPAGGDVIAASFAKDGSL